MVMSDRAYEYKGEAFAQNYAYTAVPASPPGAGETGAPPLEPELCRAASGGDQANPAGELPPLGSLERECMGVRLIFCQGLNVLLVFVPLGIISGLRHWASAWVFSLNFLAIVPLAAILGASTESLAAHVGQTMGGLLNATFGNAVEMLVTVNAIKAGLVTIVQGSLLGSILSNLLLVLGMSFLAAGLRFKENKFNITGASANVTCLALGAISLAMPTIFHDIPNTSAEDVLHISRLSSIIVALMYLLFLLFQLHTHKELFQSDDEEEEALLSPSSSILVLLGTTVAVAYCSNFLVDSIEGVTEDYGMPKAFIGVILLPIVGNAAEHATAVTVAYKGKMDLALGVAVGSSTQIALLVVPFSVLIGWAYDVPMSLDFRVFDAGVMLMSVFLASSVLHDGASNWLEGAMLMGTYALIAIICWYIPEEADQFL